MDGNTVSSDMDGPYNDGQKDIFIQKVQEYLNGSGSKEAFYDLQACLSNGEITSPFLPDESNVAAKTITKVINPQLTTVDVAKLFSNGIAQLKDDPQFTGSSAQISYLKEIISDDFNSTRKNVVRTKDDG